MQLGTHNIAGADQYGTFYTRNISWRGLRRVMPTARCRFHRGRLPRWERPSTLFGFNSISGDQHRSQHRERCHTPRAEAERSRCGRPAWHGTPRAVERRQPSEAGRAPDRNSLPRDAVAEPGRPPRVVHPARYAGRHARNRQHTISDVSQLHAHADDHRTPVRHHAGHLVHDGRRAESARPLLHSEHRGARRRDDQSHDLAQHERRRAAGEIAWPCSGR